MVMLSAADATDVLPAVSAACAVILWLPAVNAPLVNDQLPEPSAVVLPKAPSTEEARLTVLLASATPTKVGVLSKVILSVLDAPVSESVVRSGTEGTSGATASTSTAVVAPTLFNVSVASLFTASRKVPPLAARVPMLIPSVSLSPACTV